VSLFQRRQDNLEFQRIKSGRAIMSRFLIATFVGATIVAAVSTSASAYHCLAALLTEHRPRPSASSSQEPSQSHCAGAYTAAAGLVAQSHGVGRTKERPLCDRGLATPVTSSHAAANVCGVHPNIGRTSRQIVVSIALGDLL